jgi:GTP-binding protein
VYGALKDLPPAEPLRFEPFVYEKRDTKSYSVGRFDDGAFSLSGGLIDELARNVILDNYDSFLFFQKRLKDEGVIKALVHAGAKQGDVVRVLDIEFEFVE